MSRRLAPIALLLALALSVTACSSDGETGGGGGAGEATESPAGATGTSSEAATYAEGLCTAIADWQQRIEEGNRELQSALGGAEQSLDKVKAALVDFLSSAVTQTRALVDEVEALGAPDVEGGEQVASTVRSSLQEVVTLFEGVRDDVEKLDPEDPKAMQKALLELVPALQAGATEIADAFSGLQSPELEEAAAGVEACTRIG